MNWKGGTSVLIIQGGKTRVCNPYAVDWRCIRHLLAIDQGEKRGHYCSEGGIFTAFAMDTFVPYMEFVECHLHPGDMVDIFLWI